MTQLRNNTNFSKKQLRTQRLIGAKNGTIKKQVKNQQQHQFHNKFKATKGNSVSKKWQNYETTSISAPIKNDKNVKNKNQYNPNLLHHPKF